MKLLLLSLTIISFTFQPAYKKFTLRGHAQGTTWLISYYAPDSSISHAQIDSILKAIDNSLSLYKPQSLINAFNRSQTGVTADHHLLHVIKKAKQVYADTKGISDVTVYPLVNAWGFGPSKPDNLPDSQAISDLLKCIGSEKIFLVKDRLSKTLPCVQIDLNGIAQGYTVDVLATFLQKNQIKNFIVELGGEIRTSGRRLPSKEKMKIGIEAPADERSPSPFMQKIVSFENGAITTSGSYRRYQEQNGKKINHIIDPFTGYPSQNELIAVTVHAKDAITADAYDNALMAMGLKKSLRFLAAKRDVSAYFIYQTTTGEIHDTCTTGFKKLIVR